MPITVQVPEFSTEVTIPDMPEAEANTFVAEKVLPRLKAEREIDGYQAASAEIMQKAGKWVWAESATQEVRDTAIVPFQTLRNMGRWGEAAVLDVAENWREGLPPWKYEWKNLAAFWQGGLEQKEELPGITALRESGTTVDAAKAAVLDSAEIVPMLFVGGPAHKAGQLLTDVMWTSAKQFGPLMAGMALAKDPEDPAGAIVAGATGAAIPVVGGRGALALEKMAARAFPAMGEGAMKAVGVLGSQAAVDAFTMASQSPELMELYTEDPAAFKNAVVGIIAGNAVWDIPRLKGAISYGMREAMAEKAFDLYTKSPEYKAAIDQTAMALLQPELTGTEAHPLEIARMGIRTGAPKWLDVELSPVLDVPEYVRAKWRGQAESLSQIADESRALTLAEAKGDPDQALLHRANIADLQQDLIGRELGQERNAEYWLQWRGLDEETGAVREELGLSKRPLVEEAVAAGRIALAPTEPSPEGEVRAGRLGWARTAEEMAGAVPERTRLALRASQQADSDLTAAFSQQGLVEAGPEAQRAQAEAKLAASVRNYISAKTKAWAEQDLTVEQGLDRDRTAIDDLLTRYRMLGEGAQKEVKLAGVGNWFGQQLDRLGGQVSFGMSAEAKVPPLAERTQVAMEAEKQADAAKAEPPKPVEPRPEVEPPPWLAKLIPGLPTSATEYTPMKDLNLLNEMSANELDGLQTYLGGLRFHQQNVARREARAKKPDITAEELSQVGHDAVDSLTSDFNTVGQLKLNKQRGGPSFPYPTAPDEVGTLYANPIGRLLRSTVQPFRGSILFAGSPIKWFFEELPDRLTRQGGVESERFAMLAREAVYRGKRVMGEFSRFIDPALREAGRLNDFTRWANDHVVDPANPNVAFGNLLRLDPDYTARFAGTAIPTEFKPQVGRLGIANDAIGQMAGRGVPGFTPTGRIQRVLTPQMVDIIRQGTGSKAWNDLADGIAKVPENGLNKAGVEALFLQLKAQLDDAAVLANQRTISQEHIRKLKVMPSALKVAGVLPGTEVWIPLIESRPFDYLTRAAHTVANRVGALQVFGNKSNMSVWRGRVAAEGPKTAQTFDKLVRALHGMPQDSPWQWVTPGTRTALAVQGVHRLFADVVNPLALTLAAVPNTAELFAGATPWSFGWRNYVEGAWRAKSLYQDLEDLGAVTRAIRNYSTDPNGRLRSALRQFRNGVSLISLNSFLNEAQEALAASTAWVVMERAARGNLSKGEHSRVQSMAKVMGFNDTESSWLADGTASQDLRNNFIKRASPALTSGAKAAAEQSVFMGSRVGQFVLPFQSYSTARFNLLYRMAKEAKVGNAGAERLLGRMLFGTAAQGAMGTLLATVVTRGVAGLAVRLNEAADEPLQFVADALFSAIGGPYSSLWYNVQGGAGAGDLVNTDNVNIRLLYPGQKVDEVLGLATGRARGTTAYNNKTFWERVITFGQRAIPVSKAIRAVTLASGAVEGGEHQQQLEVASSAYWRWYVKKYGSPGKDSETPTARRQAARTELRQFLDGLKRDKIDTAELKEAAQANPRGLEGVVDSLRYKKMLYYVNGDSVGKPLTAVDRTALKKRIGEKAYSTLVGWDALIEGLVDALK